LADGETPRLANSSSHDAGSVRRASGEKVAALDAGGDDYVAKPFGMDELLNRGCEPPSAGSTSGL
jgi:CheY-like chemotaxis protein